MIVSQIVYHKKLVLGLHLVAKISIFKFQRTSLFFGLSSWQGNTKDKRQNYPKKNGQNHLIINSEDYKFDNAQIKGILTK